MHIFTLLWFKSLKAGSPMDFSESVQWWEEWQLRVLVLVSLLLQYFLFIAAALRKRRIPAWFKFLTWLAYLASDAVAIYALATLFNRHKKQEWVSKHRSSANLEVLWAPILLLHLGGPDSITAYNIEDNELWRRHVLTTVSQITVAIYVFRKSWSGEKRLLQVAILIFVPGILKCIEKPWALKSASINSIVNTTSSWLNKIFEEESTETKISSLADYVSAASKCVQDASGNEQIDHELNSKPYNLFVDLSYSPTDRLKNLKYMVQKKEKAHRLLRSSLSKTFDRFYTKYQMYKGLNIDDMSCMSYWGGQLRAVVIYLTFAAIGLFHKSNREVYNGTDVKITYTILCCTAALEYISTGIKPYFDCCERLRGRRPWPDRVAQYNLIGYLSRNKRHRKLRRLTSLLVCKDYLDQLWCMKPCKSSGDITELIHGHITQGWKDDIHDTASYRKFNDSRGLCTLKRHGCGTEILIRNVQRSFDESVLLWHLTTDFCFHQQAEESQIADRSREISNYMGYLLFVNPEMLLTGARRSLFRDAYEELKEMVGETLPQSEGDKELTMMIFQKLKGKKGSGLVYEAWELAQELMGLCKGDDRKDDTSKMWKVIQGVWVEMLCFSASRCRGYLHAKSLGTGGEYLSYVWLLLSYMGMETLAERMERTDMSLPGDKGSISLSASTKMERTDMSEPGDKGSAGPSASTVMVTGDEIV